MIKFTECPMSLGLKPKFITEQPLVFKFV
jgi:hypothetical protein